MHFTAINTEFNCSLKPELNQFDAYSNFKQQPVINTPINHGLSTNQ